MKLAELERQGPLPLLENRMLLMHVTGFGRTELITRSDSLLNAPQLQQFESLRQRRLAGEPIAYLLGQREFFSLSFITTPAVLIPRADTELLVELALELSPQGGSLVDLGTGSGAIAIAIARNRPDLSVCAADISPAALAVARTNAERLLAADAHIELIESDWYQQLAGRRFDVIVSNPPYIVKNDPHLQQGDLRFEPINALTDHADGLTAYRTLIAAAAEHLKPAGRLLFEHGYDQAEAVQELLLQHGFSQVQSWQDLAGIERVTGGCL